MVSKYDQYDHSVVGHRWYPNGLSPCHLGWHHLKDDEPVTEEAKLEPDEGTVDEEHDPGSI